MAPVDLAIGGFYSSADLTDAVAVEAMLANVQASVGTGPFALYGGLGYETSTMQVAYDNEAAEGGRVEIDIDGVNGIRVTAGAALTLPVIMLHTDVNVGTQTIVTVGLGFGL
jgi:hypothetical protein